MIRVALKTTDDRRKVWINLPSDIREIKLRHFTEYEAAHDRKVKLFDKLESGELGPMQFQYEYVKALIDCIKAFDIEGVENAKFGDLHKHLDGLRKAEELDIDKTEGTLITLYANIFKVIDKYDRPMVNLNEDFSFVYKGDTYTIPGGYVDAVTGQQNFAPFTTAQVVEALQVWSQYDKHRRNDPRGNFLFTSILYLLACFALPPNEEFPDNDKDIERFINERVKLFQDIPLSVGLDVLHFFLPIRKHSAATRGTGGSSVLQRLKPE